MLWLVVSCTALTHGLINTEVDAKEVDATEVFLRKPLENTIFVRKTFLFTFFLKGTD